MDKTEQFKKKIAALDSLVLKDDLEKFLKFIIDFTKSLKSANEMTIKTLQGIFNSYLEKLKSENKDELAGVKKSTQDFLSSELRKLIAEHRAKLTELNNKMAEIDAKEWPNEENIAVKAQNLTLQAIKPDLLTISQVEENLRLQGGLIATMLEDLPEPERLKIEAIKNLRKELDELKKLRTRTLGGGGFNLGGMLQHFIPWTETSVAPNGVLTDFVIGYTPNPTNTLEVMVDNSPLFETSDWTYTASTKTISFLIAPPNGTKIRYKALI